MTKPIIYMTERELARKTAYKIDTILASQVRTVEHNPRINGEIYGTSLWKKKARAAGILIALTAGTFTIGTAPDTADAALGRCRMYEPLLIEHAPRGGWNVLRMSQYMWRESRCQPEVRSRTRDTGLLQINDVNLNYLSSKLGFQVTIASLKDPTTNIRAAARLCEWARRGFGNCYRPWRTR